MSDPDAYESEMGRTSRPTDQELDRLLAGIPVSAGGDGDEEDLAGFVRDLRLTFAQSPDEETVTRHLAAIVEAAQQLAEGEGTAATAVARGSSTDRRRPPRLSLRRTPVRRFATITALLVLLAAVAGAAGAGVLPDPVQGTVAGLADHLGLSVPGNDGDRDDGTAGNGNDGQADDGADTSGQPAAEAPSTPDPTATAGTADDGQADQKNDGAVDDKDDGQSGENDDGQTGEKDDGQSGQKDDGQVDDATGAPVVPAAPALTTTTDESAPGTATTDRSGGGNDDGDQGNGAN